MIYGAMTHSLPMVLANAITLVLSLSILALKIYYETLHHEGRGKV
jgi:uncharacterized protein with PQ loop repeat